MKRPTTTCAGGSAVMMRNPVVGALRRPRRAPTRGCLATDGRLRRLARPGWIQGRGDRVVDALEPHETHLRPRRFRHIVEVLLVARGHHHGAAAGAQPKGPGGCAGGGAGAGAFRVARARRRRGRRGLESTRDARGGGSARRRPNTGPSRGALVVALDCRRHLHVASLCW